MGSDVVLVADNVDSVWNVWREAKRIGDGVDGGEEDVSAVQEAIEEVMDG